MRVGVVARATTPAQSWVMGHPRTTGSMPVRAPKPYRLSTSDGSKVGAWFETSDPAQPLLLALPQPRGSREAKPQSPLIWTTCGRTFGTTPEGRVAEYSVFR